jgi:N-acetylglutamate synthase-like GNAT family acetyltransferase
VKTNRGTIRRVRSDEIGQLSALIRNTLLISNSLDYDMKVIQNLSRQYSTPNVRDMAMRRRMYVHLTDEVIDGTVSLKGDTIYAFFVAPDRQGKGIGSRLIAFIEKVAKSFGARTLKVDASTTARKFYTNREYKTIGNDKNNSYGIVYTMEKELNRE